MRALYARTDLLDDRAVREFGLSYDALMQNAGGALARLVEDSCFKGARVLGVVGGGNNGADVLVSLSALKFKSTALLCGFSKKLHPHLKRAILSGVKVYGISDDVSARINEFIDILRQDVSSVSLNLSQNLKLVSTKKVELKWLNKFDCIIDGLFGSGLNRNISKANLELVNLINSTNKPLKIACDIPSGLNSNGVVLGACFKADITLCMGALKLGAYSDEAKDFVGKIKLARLGISSDKFNNFKRTKLTKFDIDSFVASQMPVKTAISSTNKNTNTLKPDAFVLDKSDLSLPLRKRQNSHKGSYGHAFVVAGEHIGASLMALSASSCVGAGRISLILPKQSKDLSLLGFTLPLQAMLATSISANMNAGVVGCGLGSKLANELVADDFKEIKLVVDADMFYSKNVLSFAKQAKNVLTPHPKEFASLLSLAGMLKTDDDLTTFIQHNRFRLACEFSQRYPATLVLKGANTIIAKDGVLFVMPFGSPALAKGGSGDLLAGIIAGLLAVGQSPLKASINGTLAHALAVCKLKSSPFLEPKDLLKGLRRLF